MSLLEAPSTAARTAKSGFVVKAAKRATFVAVVTMTIAAVAGLCWWRAHNVEAGYCSAFISDLVAGCKHDTLKEAGRAAIAGIAATTLVWCLIIAAFSHLVVRLWNGKASKYSTGDLRFNALLAAALAALFTLAVGLVTWPSLF